MISTIIIVSLALYWLARETDYMRIKLLVGVSCEVGACCAWRLLDNYVTEDMRQELRRRSNNGHKLTWGEFKDYIDPLCGWGYAYQYSNFKPPVSLELVTGHSKITVTNCTDIKAINEVIRVYKNPFAGLKKPVLARLAV